MQFFLKKKGGVFINLTARLVEKTSKKGNNYYCIEVEITPDYKKVVFLDQAELELIKVNSKNANKQ